MVHFSTGIYNIKRMKEIVIYGVVTGLLFIGFLSVLIIGWIKGNRKLIVISFFTLFSSILIGFFTGYTLISKSYNFISNVFKPRTGEEIYTALFGSPQVTIQPFLSNISKYMA